jgi:hypothetical protein
VPEVSSSTFDPPSIASLLNPQHARSTGLGIDVSHTTQLHVSTTGIEALENTLGIVPDYAEGHGGDGIGGISLATGSGGVVDKPALQKAQQRDTIDQLRRILGW